jgi:predicted nucleotidyltransferase
MFDPRLSRQYLRKKQEALQGKRLILWEKAVEESQAIVKMILEKYHPQALIQWGSVLDSKHFSEISDIDLAVAGLESLTFMKLLADAEALTTFPLDIVQWEAIHPSFQKIILMKGKLLHGKGESLITHQ